MAGSLIVRSVAQGDYAQWLPLWAGYNLFYKRPSVPEEITRTTWARFFDDAEPLYALVAERDERLVGLTHYLFHLSTTTIEPVCYLRDLFTEEALRGEGIGRALIEGVYERARKAGAPKVYWQTHHTNVTAMKLYDKVAQRSEFVIYETEV